jgi:hypothetical protein
LTGEHQNPLADPQSKHYVWGDTPAEIHRKTSAEIDQYRKAHGLPARQAATVQPLPADHAAVDRGTRRERAAAETFTAWAKRQGAGESADDVAKVSVPHLLSTGITPDEIEQANLSELTALLPTAGSIGAAVQRREHAAAAERAVEPATDRQADRLIPAENLSREISKAKAARLHSGRNVANPSDYIDRRIKAGTLTAPIGSGQCWRFVVSEFPQSARDDLLGKSRPS